MVAFLVAASASCQQSLELLNLYYLQIESVLTLDQKIEIFVTIRQQYGSSLRYYEVAHLFEDVYTRSAMEYATIQLMAPDPWFNDFFSKTLPGILQGNIPTEWRLRIFSYLVCVPLYMVTGNFPLFGCVSLSMFSWDIYLVGKAIYDLIKWKSSVDIYWRNYISDPQTYLIQGPLVVVSNIKSSLFDDELPTWIAEYPDFCDPLGMCLIAIDFI